MSGCSVRGDHVPRLDLTAVVRAVAVIASRICPSYYLNDAGYMYMEGVKVHEFYHNINVRDA